jgi:hypothetical protein
MIFVMVVKIMNISFFIQGFVKSKDDMHIRKYHWKFYYIQLCCKSPLFTICCLSTTFAHISWISKFHVLIEVKYIDLD